MSNDGVLIGTNKIKMRKINKNQTDLQVLLVGKILYVLVSLLSVRIMTEMLSEEQVSLYYLFFTIINLLLIIFLNPLGQFYGRNLIHWKNNNNLRTSTNTLLTIRIVSTPLALLIAILIFYVFDYDRYSNLFIYCMCISIAYIASNHGVLLNATNVIINRVTFTFWMVTSLAFGLVTSIIFVQKYETAIAWILGITTSQVIVCLYLYYLVISNDIFSYEKLKTALSKNYINRTFIFIAPVTITLLLQWGQNASFRLILEDFYALDQLAPIFVGLATSAAIFSSFESLATQYYLPLYLKNITGASRDIREKSWNAISVIMIPIYVSITIFVIALAPYITHLLPSEKFYLEY